MGQIINRRRVFGGAADYAKQYLTFVSMADNNTISFTATDDNNTRNIYVSTNGRTWETKTSSTAGTTLATLNNGGKLFVKAQNSSYTAGSSSQNCFASTSDFALCGNVMSLLYGDNFKNQTTIPSGTWTFYNMFNSAALKDITNLVMPATTLVQGCYESMFRKTSITSIPAALLPATTCAQSCYYGMFRDCTSLTSIPSTLLPATTLATYCYGNMFYACNSITSLPSRLLPATNLAESCYRQMFYTCTGLVTVASDLMGATTLATACCRAMFSGCSNLTNSPDLLASTLVTDCYRVMFNACSSITYIKCTATSISASGATSSWLGNASSIGTFVRKSGVSWSRNTSGIPSGWTIQNA